MGQRGRKSQAELAVVPSGKLGRPAPPEELSEAEAREWRDVVESQPPNWFGHQHYSMLSEYCSHMARAKMLSRELESCGLDDLDRYKVLAKLSETATKTALALARSMRITHQAQIRAETAGRRNAYGG